MICRLTVLTKLANRKARIRNAIIWVILVHSVLLNIYFLMRNTDKPPAWNSMRKDQGVLRVMKYVELERQVDDVIQDEFVELIWQCMKENLTAGLPRLVQKRESGGTNGAVAKQQQQSPDKRHRFLSSKPILNPFKFSYKYDQADVCEKEKIQVIFASPSAPANFERRMKMRTGAFGRFASDPHNRAKLLFFVGKPAHSAKEPSYEIQRKIDLEQKKYQDIVQSKFLDIYRDIVWKGLLIPKWCSTFCPNAAFVIRIDDDVSADISDLISALVETQRKHKHFILGLLRKNEVPVRDRNSKYFTSYEEYPYRDFPPYVLGGCMGYPVKTGEILYEACRRVQPIYWIDDVWISAMCAQRVNIPVLDSLPFHFKHGDKMAI